MAAPGQGRFVSELSLILTAKMARSAADRPALPIPLKVARQVSLRDQVTFFPGSAMTARTRKFHDSAHAGFSLIELLVVVAIMILVASFIIPAFTSSKSSADVTSAAYTTKGTLDQARTYAMANDTYTAVGFAGSIGNTPASVTGQVYVATLASTDGTANGFANGNYRQLGKLLKFDNTHVRDTGVPTNDGTDFESRPNVASTYRISTASAGAYTITVQGVTFSRWIQFSPRGEAVLGGNNPMTQYMEVGLFPTHATSLAASQDANGKWLGNIVAIQVSGFSGSVRVYRK